MKEIDLKEISNYVRALHCEIRWRIIDILRERSMSSEEIFNVLRKNKQPITKNPDECRGECKANTVKKLKKPSLYYHLRELEKVGIIELDEYKPSKDNRAPEKVWKLNMDKLIINFK